MSFRAPEFWKADGGRLAPLLLRPFERVTGRLTASRVAQPGWRAPVPVLCCGNAGVGGAGKTTVALDLGRRLIARGVRMGFLTRGYGARARKREDAAPILVDPTRHGAASVGDEALLLATVAPTWVAADRASAARAALAAGATMLVMDDGLQNPTLVKDVSLLVIDGWTGFGNGRLLPAGPLREPVAAAAARCAAAVLIGEDRGRALAALPPALPVLRARLVPVPGTWALIGRKLLAFAGIANPAKFFASVAEVGAEVAESVSFPDHHLYSEADLHRLRERAARIGAFLVTTAKDAARLAPEWRRLVYVLEVELAWERPDWIDSLLDSCVR
jgi:tetraacyldisaccharide 4'-kinase